MLQIGPFLLHFYRDEFHEHIITASGHGGAPPWSGRGDRVHPIAMLCSGEKALITSTFYSDLQRLAGFSFFFLLNNLFSWKNIILSEKK